MSDLALLFPGQGSQTPGMRDTVASHRPDLLAMALEELGTDPFALAAERTDCAQPSLYCASLAHWERLGRPEPAFAAGHSLGELAALTVAGSLSEEEGLRLVALRGRLMQEAADAHPPNGMVAVIGGEREAVLAAADAHGVVLANDNAPQQLVLAGARDALERFARDLPAHGARGVVLAVAGAFHSPFMASALEPFRAALAAIDLRPPRVPVVCGATAEPFDGDPDRIAAALLAPVRWREVLLRLHDLGARRFLEPGPGSVLTGLVRRTLPGVEAVAGDARGTKVSAKPRSRDEPGRAPAARTRM